MDKNLFFHKFIKRSGNATVLILHGTGGDENDLIPLAEMLFPEESILSLRGNVQEHGMNRFFERFSDGSFNLDSIREETDKLSRFLTEAYGRYAINPESIVMLGYSNGANFGLSHMFLFPQIIKKAVLLHPVLPFMPDESLSLKSSRIIVTNGRNDPYADNSIQEQLKAVLKKHGAVVEWFQHTGGHELRQEELDFVRTSLSAIER